MVENKTCAACGRAPPLVDNHYVLFSAKFGWRVSKHRQSDGLVHLDWICPECWKARKGATYGTPMAFVTPALGEARTSPTDRPPEPRKTSAPPPRKSPSSRAPRPRTPKR
jgi:hypothetical protein